MNHTPSTSTESDCTTLAGADLWSLCTRALASGDSARDLPPLQHREQHLAHLFSVLLSPTHPRAARNLADAAGELKEAPPEQRSALWIMQRYQITDLPWVRNNLVAILGEEDRSHDLRRRGVREPGVITIDMDLPAGRGLLAFFGILEKRLGLARLQEQGKIESVFAFISGGLIAHLYTGVHPCYAVEAQISAGIPCPGDVVVDLVDAKGVSQLVYLDHSSPSARGLWHPEAYDRCLPIFGAVRGFDLEVPRPIDLAVNMCTSLTQSEGLWISAMARAGLYGVEDFRVHAAQALMEAGADESTLQVYESHVELASRLIEMTSRPAARDIAMNSGMFARRNTG